MSCYISKGGAGPQQFRTIVKSTEVTMPFQEKEEREREYTIFY